MTLVDSHAHLSDEYFPGGALAEALARARAAGVGAVLSAGTRLDDSRQAVALAERDALVWAAAGIHPHEASALDTATLEELARLARHERVVAVGECGLDYHYDRSPRDVQRQALRLQVRLAVAVSKPLVLHNRESDDDLVAILGEEEAGRAGGVIHSFSSTPETARRLLALGFHLGFGGMITFKGADQVRRSLAATPLDRLLIETDSPYLTPAPHRGQRNEPARVRLVAERAALELGLAVEELAARTTANARRLFRQAG